jgi:hypothetical protein
LLAEGKLTVHTITADIMEAPVRGDSALIYRTRWDGAGWTCSCNACSRCSHVQALMLVVLEPNGRSTA